MKLKRSVSELKMIQYGFRAQHVCYINQIPTITQPFRDAIEPEFRFSNKIIDL